MNTPPADTTLPQILYYGCENPRLPGHSLHEPPAARCRDYYAQPWGGLDKQLLKVNNVKDDGGKSGVWVYEQLHGWSVVSFWDRSGDSRPGSNSAFLVQADLTAEAIWRAAWQQWNRLFLRPGWPIRPLLLLNNEREGIGSDSMYRGETLTIFRELLHDDWYIIVRGDLGASYDGYWRDSAEKTVEEAAVEALRGSQLPAAPFVQVINKKTGEVPPLFTAQ